ncbi:MAG: cadherin domain-containing protein, partial [Dongiaceae bacterium]
MFRRPSVGPIGRFGFGHTHHPKSGSWFDPDPQEDSPAPAPVQSGPTATLKVTFNSEEAGYANSMGWYNSRTGEAGILFLDLNDDGCRAKVHAGDSQSLTVLQSDLDAGNIGFFLIPNGAARYSSSLLSSDMKFEVGSNGVGRIVVDRPYGSDVVLNGNYGDVLFSDQAYNKGGYDYVSGTVGTDGQTRAQKLGPQSDGPDGILGTMAWDDQMVRSCGGGTDRDFNDVVFTVSVDGGSNPPPPPPPPVNDAPTDINLSNASINENVAGGVIGTLSTVDPNQGDTHTYSVNDSRFEVVSGQLKLKSGTSLDHETEGSVVVKVTTTDQGGLSFSEDFAITVKDVNEAPTNITISNLKVDELDDGAVIGALSTADPDVGDTHTYKVDDNRFEIVGNQLQLKAGSSLDYETEPTVTVNVTSTDSGGSSVTKAFTVNVNDLNEAPSVPVDTDATENAILKTAAVGTAVGITASSVDPDKNDSVTYSLFDNAGGMFAIDSATGVVTVAGALAVGEHTITVRATDKSGEFGQSDFVVNVSDVTGQFAVDGYIAGATVFADANKNGMRDAGEAFTITDAFGGFNLDSNGAPLVTVGGFDVATGLPFQGKLVAQPGSSVVTPLTTLLAELTAAGVPDPNATLASALGLTGVTDFGQLDPIATADTSIDAFARSSQILNTVTLVANLIVGGNPSVGTQQATAVAFAMLAGQAADGSLDLADSATLEQLINDTVSQLGLAAFDSGLTSAAAGIIGALNSAVDGVAIGGGTTQDMLAGISAVSIAAQGETANGFRMSTQFGDPEILEDYMGSALTTLIANALSKVGSVSFTVTNGVDGDETVGLTDGNDNFNALGGADIVDGKGGNDIILGGDGNDTLSGGQGNDWLDGGTGDDTLDGGSDEDRLVGGAGNDTLNGGLGADTYMHSGIAADGDDVVHTGDNGFDRVEFTTADLGGLSFQRDGNDLVIGASQSGGTGFDGSVRIVDHYAGSAIAYAMIDTVDNLAYGANPDFARFFFTTDLANGLNNDDATEVLLGGDGNDVINGNGGYYDIILGGAGDDIIEGGSGNDLLDGGAGID